MNKVQLKQQFGAYLPILFFFSHGRLELKLNPFFQIQLGLQCCKKKEKKEEQFGYMLYLFNHLCARMCRTLLKQDEM